MLCDRCHKNEAHIIIKKTVNGETQTMNLCEECALQMDELHDQVQEWGKAIFRFLADSVLNSMNQQSEGADTEKLKDMACPTCKKTYGAFLEDGLFGCSDCYDAFGPCLPAAIKGIQGADTHTGKKAPDETESLTFTIPDDPKEADPARDNSLPVLEKQLQEAIEKEDYAACARLRDQIKALKEAAK